MPFTKGDNKINRSGRPKGSKNKSELRDFISDVLSENQNKFKEVLAKLSDKDFANTYLEAMSYALPKLKSIEQKNIPELETLLLMTSQERTALLIELKENLTNENERQD